MTTELFRNGEQPLGSASAEWSVLGVLTHCRLPRVCQVLWTSLEEPLALAGAPLEAGWSLALLILRQTSCWQLLSQACVLLPWHAQGKGCLEPEPQDFLEVAVKYHPTWGCRSPRNGGTLAPCHGLSVPCSSLHRGCGLTGRGRHRAGFHVKRAIKGRNLLTWRSV